MLVVFDNLEGRVNFVDHNNLAVGYETNSECCEIAGWAFSKTPVCNHEDFVKLESGKDNKIDNKSLAESIFEDAPPIICDSEWKDTYRMDNLDESCHIYGGFVNFTIVNENTGQKFYLVLYNLSNGHYSHNFTSFAGNGNIG